MDEIYRDCTILHVDADGFFAGVEQALNPSLRGRPVVTGAERGIIAAASYEARALGVERGLQLHGARQKCPELVVVPSDYEAYSLYSRRLYEVLRRFTPHVEEYSIDEAFADLSGCSGVLGMSLEEVASQLRRAVRCEMGLTVSVGVSLTKTLAKLCSKFRKPDGQTILRREHVPMMLRRTAIDKIWGIGKSSVARLQQRGIGSGEEFVKMEPGEVLRLLHKPGFDTWRELCGSRVFPLSLNPKCSYDSMMKGHTFAPPSSDGVLIFAEAAKNGAAALAKLRRHRHLAKEVGLYLRRKDYSGAGGSLGLPLYTAVDSEVIPFVRQLFEALYVPGETYRSTMVWLGGLVAEEGRQLDLFEETAQRQCEAKLSKVVDGINTRFGQGSVIPAAMLDLASKEWHPRDATPERYGRLLRGELVRRLAIPRVTLSNPV